MGVAEALREPGTDVRIFGKPIARPDRRMAVALASGPLAEGTDGPRARARTAAGRIVVETPASGDEALGKR